MYCFEIYLIGGSTIEGEIEDASKLLDGLNDVNDAGKCAIEGSDGTILIREDHIIAVKYREKLTAREIGFTGNYPTAEGH